MSKAAFSTDTYTPDGLVVPGYDHVARKVTIITGQNLARGAVLGRITASGKYNLSLTAAADGSQVPDAILLEAADATAGDVEALALFSGGVNERALILGAAHTTATIREGLRAKGVHTFSSEAR